MAEEQNRELKNETIEGRNAVIEALRAGRSIDKIYLAKGETDKTLGHIASKAREKGVVVVECDRRKLDFMSATHAHQGVIALCAVREYCSIEDILALAAGTATITAKNTLTGETVKQTMTVSNEKIYVLPDSTVMISREGKMTPRVAQAAPRGPACSMPT